MYQAMERPFRFDMDSIFLAVNGQSDMAFGCGERLRLVLFYNMGFEPFEGIVPGSAVRTYIRMCYLAHRGLPSGL
jgi:hypothetical protein